MVDEQEKPTELNEYDAFKGLFANGRFLNNFRLGLTSVKDQPRQNRLTYLI